MVIIKSLIAVLSISWWFIGALALAWYLEKK
jgi:hypothetical protein